MLKINIHGYVVVMFLWGLAVLELESHFDHNMEPDPRTMRSMS